MRVEVGVGFPSGASPPRSSRTTPWGGRTTGGGGRGWAGAGTDPGKERDDVLRYVEVPCRPLDIYSLLKSAWKNGRRR